MRFTPWDTDKETPTPLFVNELGVKWWLDPDTTDYLHKADQFGTKILEGNVFFIETPEGEKSRVIVYKDQIVHNNQSLEATACYIDVMKMLKRDGSLDKKPRKKRKV